MPDAPRKLDRTEAVTDVPILPLDGGSTLAGAAMPESTMLQPSAPEPGPEQTQLRPQVPDRTMAQPVEAFDPERTQLRPQSPDGTMAQPAYDPNRTQLRPVSPDGTMAAPDSPEKTQAVSDLNIHATSAGAPTQQTLRRAAPRPAIPGYELIEPVGKGGMGIVYRAKQVALDRDIAIKFLRDDFHPKSATGLRFLEEARITAQLQHPGIPAVHEVGWLADERPFLVMKLIRGRTLDVLLKEQGPGSTRWMPAFEAICHAVGFAHVHGVIHRDLKPSNIMVGAFGEVQVMDWGLAKVLGKESKGEAEADEPAKDDTDISSIRESESVQTRAGSYLGTPAFMAPEQATGDIEKLGPRTDVFGLGAILCTLITGKPPYLGGSAEATRLLAAACKLEEASTSLAASTADPDLIDLCKRCMAEDPAARPADGGVVARQIASLRSYAEDRAKQAELARARTEVAIAEQKKRRRVMLFSGGAIIAVLTAGIIFSLVSYFNAVTAKEQEAEQRGIAELKKQEADESRDKEKDARKIAEDQKAISDSTLAFFLDDLLRQADAQAQQKALLRTGSRQQAKVNPTIRELLDAAAAGLALDKIDKRFPNLFEVQGSILQAVGQTYRGIAEYKKGIIFLERAVNAFQKGLGEEHIRTIDARNNLALANQSAGRMPQAIAILERVHAALENNPDVVKYNAAYKAGQHKAPHNYSLSSNSNLALAYWIVGRNDEAIALLEPTYQAYLVKEDWKGVKYGPDSEQTLTIQLQLARAYQRVTDKDGNLTRIGEAVDLLRKVYATRQRTLGADNLETLATGGALADALLEQNNVNEALELYQKVYEGHRAAFGVDHADTLTAENNMASAYLSLGNREKALQLLQHAYDVQKAKQGGEHPDTITAAINLAEVLKSSDLERALALYQAAAAGVVKLNYDHPNARKLFQNYGSLLEDQKRYAEAEPLWRNWLITIKQEEEEGTESAAYALACGVLGRNLMRQKKWEDAEPLLRDSFTLRQKLQPGTWQTFNVQTMLGYVLFQRGNETGGKLMEEGFDGMAKQEEKMQGSARYNLQEAGDRLLEFYEKSNQPVKAKALTKRLEEFQSNPKK